MKIDVYKLQRAVGPQIGIEFLWGGLNAGRCAGF